MVKFPVGLLHVFLLCLCGGLTKVVRTPSQRQPFTEKEMECFAQEKVLYSNGECYKLHNQGPCQQNEWLVYDQPANSTRLVLVCRVRPCNTNNMPIYWPEDGQCHKRADRKTLCPYQGNQLKSDSFGNGECACESKHARFETEVLRSRVGGGEWKWEGNCYPLFYRGPCGMGKLLFPKVLQGFGLVAHCVRDHCSALNNQSTPDISYVMRKEDKRCYKLDNTGPPCGPTEIFAVHPMAHLPACYSPATSLFSDNSNFRCGGQGNINQLTGECREEIILQVESFGFQATRKKRTRRRSRN